MSQAVITGSEGGSVTYASAGNFTSVNKFCEYAKTYPVQNGMEFVTASGENGAGSKNYGTRESPVFLIVVYVNTSENAVYGAFDTDMTNRSSSPATIDVGGLSIKRCFLNSLSSCIEQPKSTGEGHYWARATLYFVSRN